MGKNRKEYLKKYRKEHKEKADEYRKKYQKKNKKKMNEYQSRVRFEKRSQWKEYFKWRYGHKPQCSICGKSLKWSSDKISERVNFDHRHGKEPIKCSPQHWTASAPLSDKNIRLWNKCDFGILCCSCNNSLKTQNRKEYVKNIVKYVFGSDSLFFD